MNNPRPARPLRVLVVDNYPDANGSCVPFPTFERNLERCPYPGWCLEILHNLGVSNNIPMQFVVDNPNGQPAGWGSLVANGSFDGALGRVQRDEVDMACLMFQKSDVRLQYFDYSIPVSEVTPIFIVRDLPTTLASLLLRCFRPYDSTSWFLMLIALILQMIMWPIIGRVEIILGVRNENTRFADMVWAVIDGFLNGGVYMFTLVSGVCASVLFYVFQVGLLQAMYTAALLYALLSPSSNSPLQTSNDIVRLLKTGQYKMITKKTTWFYQQMQNNSDPLFVSLRDAVANNPVVDSPASVDDALALVQTGHYMYQVQDDMNAMPSIHASCYTQVFSNGLAFVSSHFVFRKDSPWRGPVDEAIMANYDMIDSVRRRYFVDRNWDSVTPKCPTPRYAVPGANDPLNIWSVFGIFAISAALLGVAILLFIAENLVFFVISCGNYLYRKYSEKQQLPDGSPDCKFSVIP